MASGKDVSEMTNLAATSLLSSIVMSAIILVIMLFVKLFPKVFSAKLRYIIWTIVLIGLIIPFRPVIGSGLISVESPSYVQAQTETLPATDISADTEAVQNDTGAESVKNTPAGISLTPVTVCLFIWGIVAILILAFHIGRYIRFKRMISRWGEFVTEGRVLSVFQSAKESAGLVNKKIGLRVCSFVSSSMLTGFFRPVILLPEKHLDDDELELIFKHELTHYKRHDLLVKLLIVIATSVHWFNPLVYWMCASMQTDGETSCDQAVLRDADIDDRRFYGEVIIGMIGQKSTVRTALSTCFYGGKSNIKRRLDSIMDTNQKGKKYAVIGIALAAILTILSGSIIAFAGNDNTLAAEAASGITAESAQEIALAAVGGGTITKCEIDHENGNKVYDITIIYGSKKYEMDVDTITGAITNYEIEAITQSGSPAPSPAPSDTASSASTEEMTAEKANKIALAETGGGTVVEYKTDFENGRKVYEITIVYDNNKYEMDVDVITGEITNYEAEAIYNSSSSSGSSTSNSASSGSSSGNSSSNYHHYDYDDDHHDNYDDYDD